MNFIAILPARRTSSDNQGSILLNFIITLNWLLQRAITFFFNYTLFFCKQHFYKQHQAEIGQKNRQMLWNTPRLNICYLKIVHILYPCSHPKTIGHNLKKKNKNKCICIHKIISLIIMKMKVKTKNGSHKYNISRTKHEQI